MQSAYALVRCLAYSQQNFCQYVQVDKSMEPEKKMTEGIYLKQYESFFDDHMVSMTRQGENVIFVSDGRFGIRSDHKWKKSFKMGVGETFNRSFNRHEWCEFKILDILDTEVKIRYESGFDHRSFGKNLVSIDSGIIILKYGIFLFDKMPRVLSPPPILSESSDD